MKSFKKIQPCINIVDNVLQIDLTINKLVINNSLFILN